MSDGAAMCQVITSFKLSFLTFRLHDADGDKRCLPGRYREILYKRLARKDAVSQGHSSTSDRIARRVALIYHTNSNYPLIAVACKRRSVIQSSTCLRIRNNRSNSACICCQSRLGFCTIFACTCAHSRI
jgi:hypothetical protein